MFMKNIQRSAEINVAALKKVKPQLRLGMTEKEIAKLVKRELLAAGAEKLAFPTIAALTANAATPHHVPTDRRAKKGDLLVLDMGGVYNGMRADMTRTLFFGEPRAEFKRLYNHVLESQTRAYRGVRAGRTGGDIDAIARSYLKSHGLSQYFIHSLGHGVGRAIHERPWVTPGKRGENILKSGVAITIEPGIYRKGMYGFRIEDTCEVLDRGTRWLVPMQRHISRMIVPV